MAPLWRREERRGGVKERGEGGGGKGGGGGGRGMEREHGEGEGDEGMFAVRELAGEASSG